MNDPISDSNKCIGCEKCGIMPPHKFYKCRKCNKAVSSNEIERKRCPLCFNVTLMHIGCGGKVIEDNLFRRYY